MRTRAEKSILDKFLYGFSVRWFSKLYTALEFIHRQAAQTTRTTLIELVFYRMKYIEFVSFSVASHFFYKIIFISNKLIQDVITDYIDVYLIVI